MKKFLLFLALSVACATVSARQVSGNVMLDDTGMGEPGVNIVVTGTTTGTITDIDGNYTLEVPDGQSLTFSYLGYESQTITPTSGTVNVTLAVESEQLEEFVAVGYGTMRKSDVTGAISSVKGDQLQKTPAASVDQALQGRAAGVTVNSSSGQPGAAAEIRIRGIGSVNGSSSPIYVVDGIIVEDISFLSPNDIASTEILKDASSSSIYGSRAANGVVLITTKSGSSESMANISVNAYAGFQNAWRKLDLMNAQDYAKAMVGFTGTFAEKAALDESFQTWLQAYRLGDSKYFPTFDTFDYANQETDWQEEVFNSYAPIQNYSISVDGADDKFSYAISGSYFQQDGTIIGSDYHRFTIRANTSYKVRKWLKVGENLSYSNSGGRNATVNNASPGSSILSAALAMAPWDPTHYPTGATNAAGDDLSGQIAASSNFKNVTNPFSMVEERFPQNNSERWVGNVYLDITPVKGLTLHSSVGMDMLYVRDKSFSNKYKYSSYDQMQKNFLSSSMYRSMRWTVDNTITYARDFGKHNMNIMVGQSTEQYDYYYMGGSGAVILNPVESNWYLANTTEDKTDSSDDVDRQRMVSFFGRLFYGYDNRYLVTVNFRADGSSKFPQNPWGYFPSVSLAWRMSEESWLKDHSDILDMLKIRAGWGQLGNQSISQDQFTMNMFSAGPTFVDYVFGSDPSYDNGKGATILTYVNEGGKWETTEQWNVGVDLSMWGGMLTATVDGYIRDTRDMLLNITTPAHVGNRYYLMGNVGTMRNQGIDISLGHSNMVGDFRYSIDANISLVQNELTALNGGSPVINQYWRCDVGLPVFTYWGYNYLGVYQSDEEAREYLPNDTSGYGAGDAKYEDLNNDGKIDDNDRTALGNNFPWLTYGLNFSFEWKGLDFQMFFQGVYGNEIYNALRERTESAGTTNQLSPVMANAWSNGVANGDGSIPDPTHSQNFAVSSRFVEDGAYLRLKTLQIGYSLPRDIIRKAHFNRVRFYVSANNLFTITNYTGYDPEVNNYGVDFGNYPQARSFTFGVNLDF